MRQLLYFFCGLLCFALPSLLNAQAQGGTQVKFGKNRVQYHNDFAEWSQYESDNFFVYWYGKSRTVGQKVVQMAEFDFDEIQALLEHRLNEKLQIIVYSDITDVKQSNIGSEDLFANTTGETKVSGTTIFVYYNGSYRDLRKQVREGIASVYLNTMLYGVNIQEIVQNAVLLNLPNWFKSGLVAYAGESWNTQRDNELRSMFLSGKFKRFERFADSNPRLVGQSIWYFISERYGKTTVSNLLYLTRINRSIESGFLYVLDKSYQSVIKEWEEYFRNRYLNETKNRTLPLTQTITFKKRDQLPVTQLKISPDGSKLVYVLNEIGRASVYLYDLKTNKKKRIFREGYRNALQATDLVYPLLAWNPNNRDLVIVYEHRDNLKLATYDVRKHKIKTELLSEQFQRLYSVDFVDPMSMVFSGTVSGQTDLYSYFLRTRQSQRLTNDIYDDVEATVVNVRNRKGILFASNRPEAAPKKMRADSILPIETFDIYYLDLQNASKELVQVTKTPFANERQPMAVDTAFFSYLSDRSGIFNREIGHLEDYIHHYVQHVLLTDGSELDFPIDSSLAQIDSTLIDTVEIRPVIKQKAITHSQTNYAFNLWYQHSSTLSNKVIEMVPQPGPRKFYIQTIDPLAEVESNPTMFEKWLLKGKQPKPVAIDSFGLRIPEFIIPQIPVLPAPAIPTETVPTQPAPTPTPASELTTPPIQETKPIAPEKIEKPATDTAKVDDIPDGYLFQSEFDVPVLKTTPTAPAPKPLLPALPTVTNTELPAPAVVDTVAIPKATTTTTTPNIPRNPLPFILPGMGKPLYLLNPSRTTPYRLQYRTDYMNTEVNNNLLFDGLQNIAANPNGFQVPQVGILFKANIKDLFEDYEFEGGIRIPTTFNGAEYYLTYQNKKKRLDQIYSLYMRNYRINQSTNTIAPKRQESNILLGQYGLRYPLDVFRSIRGTFTLRRDQLAQLATDRTTFNTPTQNVSRIGFRLEYVFDNTVDLSLNIRTGTRYRFFAESVKRFNVKDNNGLSLEFSNGFMTILGMDIRHYEKVLRHSIIATRLAGNTSFGSERMLYFLGGVDNWLIPQNNQNITIPSGNFAYQTLAANLRGFPINIRNGSSYVLSNTELRVPIFQYLSKRIQSALLKNFQLVGFFDFGTAWQGSTPFRYDNPLNTSVFKDGNVINVTVNYFRDPIVAGYGFGARTMLFGYFIRADYAWGIETRQVQKPRLYLALGMDF
jgi:Tol biopolymer transport system component